MSIESSDARGTSVPSSCPQRRRLALASAALVAGLLLSGLSPLGAMRGQSDVARQAADRFTVRDEMIPMRDGARLHTRIFAPKDQREPLPFLMNRTPYGIGGIEGRFDAAYKALADEGYVFVFQDIRGKFGSEGTFIMQRPARAMGDTTSLDEEIGRAHV